MKTSVLVSIVLLLGAASLAHADDAACAKIHEANARTDSNGAQMKATGYAFAKDTPRIYGPGEQTCKYLRDETVNGEAAAVYGEQYESPAGRTDATIWISRSSGRLLREEQDGDIAGKGRGHISYQWPSRP